MSSTNHGHTVPVPPALLVNVAQPLYGATLGQAFVRFWKKYAVLPGRASRSELWWMALVGFLVGGAFFILDFVLTGGNLEAATDVRGPGGVLWLIWDIATVVPTVALQTRRLHDTNRSGWWQLLILIPVVGAIVLIVFLASASDPAGSRYDRLFPGVPETAPVPGTEPHLTQFPST